MEPLKYSSSTVEALLTNDRWNFWKKDWSKRIIVEWDTKNVPLAKFKADVISHVGRNFGYERALNSKPTDFVASVNGLVPFEKANPSQIENDESQQRIIDVAADFMYIPLL